MDQKEILTIEYKAIQESISHYEKMIWTVGSVSNALVIALIGAVISLKEPYTILFVFFFSCVLHGFWWLYELRLRQFNISKFRRIWEIERILGMNHHLKVMNDDLNRKPRPDTLITFLCITFPGSLFLLFLYAKYYL